MNDDVKIETVMLGTGALALFGAAVIDAPYFFYVLLRVFICLISAFLASKCYGGHRHPLAWALAAVALLFNPLVPVKMARSDWQVINVLTAILFIAFLVYLNWKRLLPRANVSYSISRIRNAAEKGDAEAQNKLGLLLDGGAFGKQDYAQAAVWYRRGADQGSAKAQFNLASLYYNGQGVPKDHVMAATWYHRAAEQGDPDSQVRLGGLYRDGKGVTKDIAQTLYWYRRAADGGHAPAQNLLAVLYANGQEVQQDYEQAAQWYRKAADQNFAYSQAGLAALYQFG